MSDPVYLDYNATTPVDPAVVQAMLPYFTQHYGNPSSKRHVFGWAADEAVTVAREQVAALIGARPDDVLFTGGATEALNLAIKGIADARQAHGRHVITAATEHKASLASCKSLERRGFVVTVLPVDENGQVRPSELESALRDDTVLVSLMWANNETGALHPMRDIVGLVGGHPATLICDATQAVGKVPVDVEGIDLLACSGHKFYAPKGIGALYVAPNRRAARLRPLLDGGSQERGLRGGTLNVPGIVGMGKAAELAGASLDEEHTRLSSLRDGFEHRMANRLEGVQVHGQAVGRLPNTSNLALGVPSDRLLPLVPEIAVSTGSACSTGSGTPSHVLTAMGVSKEVAGTTLRVSLGRMTTEEEVGRAIDRLASAAESITPVTA